MAYENRLKLNGFKNKLIILFGGICCIFLCIFIVLSIPVYLFRCVVILLAKVFRPDLDEILNATSSAFVNDLFSQKSPRTTVVVTVYLRGRYTLEAMKDNVLTGWINAIDKKNGQLTFRQFQQYPERWMGFTFYKNAFDTFNVDNHVFLHTPQNGQFVDEEELTDLAENLMNAKFFPKQSPWELHVVSNYKDTKMFPDSESEEFSAFIFKVHHSLADGFSIVSAIVEGIGCHSLANMKMPVPKSPQRTMSEKVIYLATLPFTVFFELSYILSNLFRPSPWKVPDNEKVWYQVCSKSELISITSIKFIKNSFNVSFTSVLLAAVSAAIHKTLENKNLKNGKSVSEGESFGDDGSMYCLSTLPLHGRSKKLTNHVTGAFFDIPTVKFGSSVERLRNCDEILEQTKKTVVPSLAVYYVRCVGSHFYPIVQLFQNKMVSTGLSNFPSVPVNIVRSGKKGVLVDFISGGHEGVAGVGIMVLSYHEHIRVCVTAEKALLSKEEAKRFVQYVADEINTLLVQAGRQSS